MGFHVDYGGIDKLYSGLYGNASAWNSSIAALSESVKILVTSSNMEGAGADNVKSYFDSVHNTIIPVLNSLLTAHVNNCLLYVRNYQSGIDTSLHAIIDEAELRQIKRTLNVQEDNSEAIESVVQNTLHSVSDIIDVSCTGFPVITDHNREIQELIEHLLRDVWELEETHYQNDFIYTSQLISALKAFITEHLSDLRSYKANFSVESFAKSDSFIALAQAYVAVNAQIEANQDAVLQAIEEENNRIDELTAEAEARQKEATAEKWTVTGLCVVGSIAAIAVIVGTGGTATPLVVGTVSAVSGAVIAGNNAAADEYVAHGWDTGKWDMENIGTSAVLGGVSGFITGYVGAGLGGTISEGLSKSVIGTATLNSSSLGIRLGSSAIIGSTSEVVTGVCTRGVSEFTVSMIRSGGDVESSFDSAKSSALDWHEIVFDATVGGLSNGYNEYKQYKADMAVRSFNEKRLPADRASERGYQLKTSSENGTLEYAGTDYIKHNSEGKEISVTIEATGSRSKDFKAAWEKAYEKFGITKDDFDQVTWQHMDDYSVRSNTFTLELVDTKAHMGIPHAGGCKQWEVFNGLEYK